MITLDVLEEAFCFQQQFIRDREGYHTCIAHSARVGIDLIKTRQLLEQVEQLLSDVEFANLIGNIDNDNWPLDPNELPFHYEEDPLPVELMSDLKILTYGIWINSLIAYADYKIREGIYHGS